MRKRIQALPWLLPILFILVIVTIFFYKVIFFGKVPLPGDLLLSAYYPWHDYAWPPYTAGVVPVKNAEHSDAISQFFPFAKFTYDQLRSGTMPLWNPLIGSGMPFLATFHTSVLSPINLLVFVLPLIQFWSASVILPVLAFGLFTYLFFKSQVTSRWAALIGAIGIMFSSFTMFWIEYGPGLKTAMWTPLLLLSIFRFVKTNTYYWFFLIAISTAFLATGGDVQVFIYSMLLAIALLFYWQHRSVKLPIILFVLIAIALGLGMASPQLLLTQEFQKLSGRADLGFKYLSTVNFGITPISKIITFLAPDYFGNSATKNYWNTFYYFSGLSYLGILPLILSLFSFLRREKIVYVLWGSLAIIAIFFYDWPAARLVYNLHVPLFSTVSANRMFFLVVFILGFLAVLGAEKLLEDKVTKKHYLLLAIIPSILIIATILTVILKQTTTGTLTQNLAVSLRNLVLPWFFLLLYGAGIVALFFRPKSRVIQALLIFLLCTELLRFGFKVTPFVDKSFVFPNVALTDFLHNDYDLYRVSGSIPSNFLMAYNIPSEEGYDSLTVRDYSLYMGTANQSETPGAYLESFRPESLLLSLANVKYIVDTKFDEKGVPSSTGKPLGPLQKPPFVNVFNDHAVGLYENTNALPRARLVNTYTIVKHDAVWSILRNESEDLKTSVLLEEEPPLPIASQANGSVQIVDYSANRVSVKTVSDSNALLVLADTYFPGWQAFVDGNQTKILKAYGVFRAVAVPSGIHTITFRYAPQRWTFGLISAALSFAATILLTIFLLKQKRWQLIR